MTPKIPLYQKTIERKLKLKLIEKDLEFFMEIGPLGKRIYHRLDKILFFLNFDIDDVNNIHKVICNKYKVSGGYNTSESNLHSILEEIKDSSYNANLNFDIYFMAATLI